MNRIDCYVAYLNRKNVELPAPCSSLEQELTIYALIIT